MGVRAAFAVPLLVLLVIAGIYERQRSVPSHGFLIPSTGLNYYDPTGYFSGCPEWTWLQPSCFKGEGTHESASAQLQSDMAFVRARHLGSFLRVWVSLDQLMRWNARDGFAGFRVAGLSDLDAALRMFAAKGVQVDLVAFVYSHGSGAAYQFRPEALDGLHDPTRTGYLRALAAFIGHLARNAVDASTVRVIDLQTEPYYQLEQYFRTARSLGAFQNCRSSTGGAVTSCVDRDIIHPWLEDMYRVARGVSSHFAYTLSDTGRLLTVDGGRQRYWESMYPGDVYDIHLYDDQPWLHRSRWITGLKLEKVWFAGEAGCGSGNKACTYDGARAAPIDRWWLNNMPRYGARSVLLESHVTLWTYPDGPNSQTLTPTGTMLACHAQTSGLCSRPAG